MRRLHKTGALDPTTDEVVVIPRLPSVAGANKPPGSALELPQPTARRTIARRRGHAGDVG
jgi:hypothetical protein